MLLVLVGTSYAFYKYSKVGQKKNQVTTGNFQVSFQEESGAISLKNTYPMKDEEGKSLEPFTFSVENKGNITAKYQISIVEDENNTLDRSSLRYELKKQGEEGEISNLDDLVIKNNVTLDGLQKDTYELRIWLDENTGNEAMGKIWKGKVQVVAEESKAYAFEDYIAPTIKLKGEKVMTVEKGGTFEDPGVESVSDNVDSLTKEQVKKRYEYFDGEKTSIVGSVNTNQEGVYIIYYELLDTRGNKGVAARTINVVQVNKKAPVITLKGEETLTYAKGDYYVEPGVTAKDEVNNDLTSQIITIHSLNLKITGTQIVKYFVIDKDGNIGSNTRTIKVERGKQDESGANAPELAEGMIPVIYDDQTKVWKKADMINDTWYDYNQQMWGNAVTVVEKGKQTREYYQTAKPGTAIDMEDINTMWVWIPRYEYDYVNIANYAGGTQAQPGAIGIKFLNGTSNSTTTNYMLHPAFTFGDEELTGFWYGKFETSNKEQNCTAESDGEAVDDGCDLSTFTPQIKPSVTSWRGIRIATAFTVSQKMVTNYKNEYGFNGSEDTHMSKNSEWGAVAYLSQSKYGEATEEVYFNNCANLITGISGDDVVSLLSSTTCTTNTYDTTKGQKASTTGTIYGVYDMSGGAVDYVMVVWADSDGKLFSGKNLTLNSGFNGKLLDGNDYTSGIPFPNAKYYDLYTSTTLNQECNGNTCYGHALSETAGWYNDQLGVGRGLWLARGGYANLAKTSINPVAGIFYTAVYEGAGWFDRTFRLTLVP